MNWPVCIKSGVDERLGFIEVVADVAANGGGDDFNTAWNIMVGGASTLADVTSIGLHNSIYWVQLIQFFIGNISLISFIKDGQ